VVIYGSFLGEGLGAGEARSQTLTMGRYGEAEGLAIPPQLFGGLPPSETLSYG